MMCDHVYLSLKRKNAILLSNYLEQGSPHIDGLHFCLTDSSPIKNPSESKSLKKTKKMTMMIWLHQEEKKGESMFRKKGEMVNT